MKERDRVDPILTDGSKRNETKRNETKRKEGLQHGLSAQDRLEQG